MPLEQEWKTATTAFEATTNQKKPSAKFLGFVKTGAGIKTALKEADAAKTPEEFAKAKKKFQDAARAYTDVLKKAAADPASVPFADKPVYVAAIAKLQAALDKIYEDATKQEQAMNAALKTVAPDADLIRKMEILLPLIGHFKTISARASEAAPIADSLHKAFLKLSKGEITQQDFNDQRDTCDIKMKMVFELTKYIQDELEIYNASQFKKP